MSSFNASSRDLIRRIGGVLLLIVAFAGLWRFVVRREWFGDGLPSMTNHAEAVQSARNLVRTTGSSHIEVEGVELHKLHGDSMSLLGITIRDVNTEDWTPLLTCVLDMRAPIALTVESSTLDRTWGAMAGKMTNVVLLNLEQTAVTSDCARIAPPNIDDLICTDCKLECEALVDAGSELPRSLQGICLENCSATDGIFRQVLGHEVLHHLEITRSGLSDRHRGFLKCTEVGHVSLGGNEITDEWFDVLQTCREMNLLSLRSTRVTGRKLAAIKSCKWLALLILSDNELDFRYITAANLPSPLGSIDLRGTGISHQQVEEQVAPIEVIAD